MRYPNVYRKKTKSGIHLYTGDVFPYTFVAEDIIHIFSYDKEDACNVLLDWFSSRPIVDYIPNSTNPDVLIYVL